MLIMVFFILFCILYLVGMLFEWPYVAFASLVFLIAFVVTAAGDNNTSKPKSQRLTELRLQFVVDSIEIEKDYLIEKR